MQEGEESLVLPPRHVDPWPHVDRRDVLEDRMVVLEEEPHVPLDQRVQQEVAYPELEYQ